jgi:hypothetical protein
MYDGSESIPSDEYDTYTLPTSSAKNYTALHNGLIYLVANVSADAQYYAIVNLTGNFVEETRSSLSGGLIRFTCQVKKGDSFQIQGDIVGNVSALQGNIYKGSGTLYFKVANTVVNQEEIDVGEVVNVLDKLANIDLSNLTSEGEKHFLNKTQLTNCILEAPNGVATYEGNTITVKAGLKVLIPNGRNSDRTLKNIEYTVPEDISYTTTNSAFDMLLLRSDGTYVETNRAYYFWQNDTPTATVGWWYRPKTNQCYTYTNNSWNVTSAPFMPILQASQLYPSTSNLDPYMPIALAKEQDLDGKWIFTDGYSIVEQTSITTAEVKTYSLSSYLPKDSNIYEVLGSVHVYGDSSNGKVELGVGSYYLPNTYRVACSNNSAGACGSFVAVIGADREIRLANRSSYTSNATVYYFRVFGYRRVR